MKVILLETKEVKQVANGYARNYLFPQGLAVLATKKNLKKLEKQIKEAEEKRKLREEKAIATKKKLEGEAYKIKAKAGEGKKLYGSVTTARIAKAIGVGKQEVLLKKPIKELGDYQIEIKVDSQKAKIKLKVVREK